ncbi:TPA: rod shape-determining protein [Candidatus Collierbacteria bacterium]|uniref:Cell shape-determining protein MreB n=1 Tax=Candidatus Collierbacteria bacterium GW2011_GWB2_44_22 TaxID=1618387 RepID=A0A0G1HXN3_9BACT|nr:MAG: Rod shape-determining protein MreB [Candidatus Collierbacteria bacterium GW2011_GWA2_44_13]KKT51695.1 MAG: Rod shape-determining protein MreB [Candidatus Collierbacteria bacterium GW2011_GWB2_44_22]KKT62492.1 MAG: Rod shape-determining protein MreB [Candidatus Collierbacteria bacterium GW2011_GWD1_44_27]KKT66914.1 MAG: Rod shape-determining protein MreB [Candidatus Collierbacteria bacterium GW2011_GWC2_44_30]KKT88741.1 MAG: Rod shape-determining protein MreB [Candidatus Collierbacteria 
MFEKLWRLATLDVGIDLGTANVVVHVRGKGVVIRQPSVVARHMKTKEILAMGDEAKKMLGKNPANIEVVRPLRDGVIADFDAAEAMLKHYIVEVHELYKGLGFKIPRPRVAIGIPSGVTEVERRAVQEAALEAGARAVFLIEEPMAAAIGSGLPVEKAEGQLICDIGGGTSEIGVISLGGLVLNRSLRVAGDELTEAIQNFVRLKYSLLLGESTAEEVKIAVGSAYPQKREKEGNPLQIVVRGRSLEDGLPKSLKLDSVEIRESMMPICNQILGEIALIIEETPPDLVADILEKGMVMAGGGSLIRGFDKLISEQIGMPVWVTDTPLEAVVRGCAKVLENDKLLSKVRVVGGLR